MLLGDPEKGRRPSGFKSFMRGLRSTNVFRVPTWVNLRSVLETKLGKTLALSGSDLQTC